MPLRYPVRSRNRWNVAMPSVAAVAPPATPFVTDTFITASDQTLTAHTSDSGHTWTLQTGGSGTAQIDNATDRLRGNTLTSCYYPSAAPASANHDAEVTLIPLGVLTGAQAGPCVRMSTIAATMYYGRYNPAVSGWQILKIIAGTGTQIGATIADTLSVPKIAKLEVRGTTLKLYVDDVAVLTEVDTAIAGPGYPGLRISTPTTNPGTTGIWIDNFKAYNA